MRLRRRNQTILICDLFHLTLPFLKKCNSTLNGAISYIMVQPVRKFHLSNSKPVEIDATMIRWFNTSSIKKHYLHGEFTFPVVRIHVAMSVYISRLCTCHQTSQLHSSSNRETKALKSHPIYPHAITIETAWSPGTFMRAQKFGACTHTAI